MANEGFNLYGGSRVDVVSQARTAFISSLFRQPPSSGAGSFSAIDRRLTMFGSSEDTRTIAGVEKVWDKIDSAVKVGVFGSEPGIINYIESYKDALKHAVTYKDVILKERNNLYTLTRPSNIKKEMQNARNIYLGGEQEDKETALEYIENQIIDLSITRDKMSDIQKLPKSLDDRFMSSIAMLDNALQEFGGNGLSKEELNRIMNSTYAIMKKSDAEVDANIAASAKLQEWNMPQYREKQYIDILEGALTNINAYDDDLDLLYAESVFMDMSEPIKGADLSAPITAKKQKVLLLEQHRERLKARYSQQYKNAYNDYKELRKKHPDRMVFLDWDKLKNDKIHNELMNYVPRGSNNNNNIGIYNPESPKDATQARKLIGNMLTTRPITFTKNIYDIRGKVWKSEGESIKGFGPTGKDTWKIKNIVRDKNDNLEKITLIFPSQPGGYKITKTTLGATMPSLIKNEVTLTPDNFVIEDDSNLFGPGYKPAKDKKFGKTSYNVFTNRYELIK